MIVYAGTPMSKTSIFRDIFFKTEFGKKIIEDKLIREGCWLRVHDKIEII
jgi:hypothetical protein